MRDAVLFPGGAHEWDWLESGTRHHSGIQPAAVMELIERGAKRIILSTGVLGALRVSSDAVDVLAQHGVAVEVLRTPRAVARYNALAAAEPVGALIHSTC